MSIAFTGWIKNGPFPPAHGGDPVLDCCPSGISGCGDLSCGSTDTVNFGNQWLVGGGIDGTMGSLTLWKALYADGHTFDYTVVSDPYNPTVTIANACSTYGWAVGGWGFYSTACSYTFGNMVAGVTNEGKYYVGILGEHWSWMYTNAHHGVPSTSDCLYGCQTQTRTGIAGFKIYDTWQECGDFEDTFAITAATSDNVSSGDFPFDMFDGPVPDSDPVAYYSYRSVDSFFEDDGSQPALPYDAANLFCQPPTSCTLYMTKVLIP